MPGTKCTGMDRHHQSRSVLIAARRQQRRIDASHARRTPASRTEIQHFDAAASIGVAAPPRAIAGAGFKQRQTAASTGFRLRHTPQNDVVGNEIQWIDNKRVRLKEPHSKAATPSAPRSTPDAQQRTGTSA